ncbi:MAG: tRNA dihydrouridine synthase [Chloroflexota bacterium]
MQPIRLSNGVAIAWPVALAPMAGVTDAVFRELCHEHGCGYATTEFARDRALLMGVPSQVALIDVRTDPRPVGVQIFGADPDEMRRAAGLVMERMAPDVLDINMGCPAPKVTNGQGGSSLLREPDRAAAIVDAIVREIAPAPVTVKIRVGWDEGHKASGAAVDVARRVVDAGAQLITVHGRTREQKYEGQACWDTISAVAAAVPVPVIGNGDIATPEEAAHRLRTSGCRGIAIGRGARGRPWVFRQINAGLHGKPAPPDPTPAERVALGLEHIRRQRAMELAILREDPKRANRPEASLVEEADRRALGSMLPHVMWYVWGVPSVTAARRALSQAKTATQLADILADFGARWEGGPTPLSPLPLGKGKPALLQAAAIR